MLRDGQALRADSVAQRARQRRAGRRVVEAADDVDVLGADFVQGLLGVRGQVDQPLTPSGLVEVVEEVDALQDLAALPLARAASALELPRHQPHRVTDGEPEVLRRPGP